MYIANGFKLEHRPTLGRIDHDLGYTLENFEVQGYSINTSSRMRERSSIECVAIVVLKASEKLILLECSSAKNAIQRINEVSDLELTRNMLKVNLSNGQRFNNEECSAFGKPSLTVHSLRHSFATHYHLENNDVPRLKNQLGHSSIQTTMIYTHLTDEEMRNAVDNMDR